MQAVSRFSLTVFSAVLFCSSMPAPARAQVVVEDLVNVRFQGDARVFAVMAALNAAGFDVDADMLPADSTRRLVRGHLSAIPDDLRARLRDFYASAAGDTPPELRQGRFVSYALLLNGPPGFSNPFRQDELPEDARPVFGFEKLVAELWRKAGLGALWNQFAPQYVAEIESYRPMIREMIISALRYAHTEARVALDRQVTFIPDLLNAYGMVNARNISSTYVVVVGPSRAREIPLRSIRHEYLHFLLDPLIEKYRARLPDPAPFLARVAEIPTAEQRYRTDFNMLLTESLIRGLELRLSPDTRKDGSTRLLQLYDQGLILAPYFAEAFEKFESRSEPLHVFFPELISGLTWEQESKRAEAMTKIRSETGAAATRDATAAPSEDPARKGLRDLLLEGNRLLQAREFDEAAGVLERAVAIDPASAGALFGLGQACMQRQDFDRALDLYAKAAEAAKLDEIWIAGWSYVYRGNVFRFLDEPEKARGEWSRALQLGGELRGAAAAARKALAEK